MSGAASIHVFRVTVRGQFAQPTEQARSLLVRSQPEHDITLSAYTAQGTFSYDAGIGFFNPRIQFDSTERFEIAAHGFDGVLLGVDLLSGSDSESAEYGNGWAPSLESVL
jgi:hypothetical protein